MTCTLWIILNFLPFVSAILCGCFGRLWGSYHSMLLGTILMGCTAMFAIRLFFVCLFQKTFAVCLGSWVNLGTLSVNWVFLFDSLSVVMLVLITVISFCVHMYSIAYMEEDPHGSRFIAYLSLFTFFMILLVTAGNFLILFLGWEGVGLCSYLLINFWFTRVQANKAAIKALIINKFGDYALLLAIVLIQNTFNSLDYWTVFLLAPYFLDQKMFIFFFEFGTLNVICCLLFLGSIGKSAQLGLHTWLPDAMEGPTPVSALLHAATMVTAGVFLVIRCSPIFEFAPIVLNAIALIGSLTAFFAATVGLFQYDIKKIIAYSTCSQLGYMFFVCGLSGYSIAIFHLTTHAFFKALLFLSAGSIIHSMGNEQDIRKMGGLVNVMPFTYTMFLIGSFSLIGFPFLSGFYSKDAILEVSAVKFTVYSEFFFFLGSLTAMLTALYSFRLVYFVFLSKPNGYKGVYTRVSEMPVSMAIPLVILSLGSIFLGYTIRDLFVGLGSDFFIDAIFILPKNNATLGAEFLPLGIKFLPTAATLIGGSLGDYMLYGVLFKQLWVSNKVWHFFHHKWYFDYIYNGFLGRSFLLRAYTEFFEVLEKGFIELILGHKLVLHYIFSAASATKFLQTGQIYNYICSMLLMSIFIYLGIFILY